MTTTIHHLIFIYIYICTSYSHKTRVFFFPVHHGVHELPANIWHVPFVMDNHLEELTVSVKLKDNSYFAVHKR